ncbi:MAG: DUF4296 domain-containing protein [Chitinophagaceae bacterium]|nr:MAG: DUF4296 domain-containing protein [Chitinophagaceae bacterium]
MRTLISFLVLTVGLISCSEKNSVPKDILPPEKMQAVYWDYLRADIYSNEFLRKDTSKNAELENARLQMQVFKLHKVSREQFYKSYEYYLDHRELMKDILDTMLVRQQEKSADKKDSALVSRDSTSTLKKDSLGLKRPGFKLDSMKSIL